MALPATADFTGTNGTAVRTLTNWDGAASYTRGGGACVIQSNAAQAGHNTGTAVGAADWWTGDTFDDDQYSEATVTALASGIYIGVAIRCGGTDNGSNVSGYFFYSDSADGCYLDKWVNGEWVATVASGTVFSVNDVIRIEINGNAITCKVNGTSRLTYTDSSSPITSGRAGICVSDIGSSRIDDWEGGNLSTGITGTASITLGALTSSAAGKVAIVGAATPTLGALTLSAAGEGEATGIEGALAVTLGALTSSAAGTVAIAGAAAATLGALTSSATGVLAIAGAGAPTLGAATLAATATLAIAGAAAPTLADATVTAAGVLATAGASAPTLDALTSSAAGVVAIAGAATPTLDAATLIGAGVLAIAGAATPTLEDAAATAAGALAIAGAATPTLGALTSSAAGALAIAGAATIELGAATLTAAGVLIVPGTGVANITLGAVTSSAAGVLAIVGTATPTLGAVTSSAAGALAIAGAGASTLADATITAAGALAIAGEATPTLDAITLAATGALIVAGTGALDSTLDAATIAATGALAVTGEAAPTLDALSVSASSALLLQGQASVTLAELALYAIITARVAVSIVDDFVWRHMTAHAGLTALVDDRVYRMQLPGDPTLPAIVYTRIATTPHPTRSSSRGALMKPRYRMDVWGATRGTVRQAVTQVRIALGSMASAEEPRMDVVLLQNDARLIEVEPGRWRAALDVDLWHDAEDGT